MQHRRWWMAGFAAATLALITSATALGYAGQTAAAITIAGPAGAVACGTDVTVTATITDSTGTLVAGGGYLPINILDLSPGDGIGVTYTSSTGFYTWNRSAYLALVQI